MEGMAVGLRDKLKRLEQLEGETIGVLTLPDGSSVRYRRSSLQEEGDMYEAFLACMDGREHWLLPYVRQMDTRESFPGLVRALESSRARRGVMPDGQHEAACRCLQQVATILICPRFDAPWADQTGSTSSPHMRIMRYGSCPLKPAVTVVC